MIEEWRLEGATLDALLVLCRVSACLLVIPGFSSARVPVRVRLFFAIVLSLVVAPFSDGQSRGTLDTPIALASAVIVECVIGVLIGLGPRLLMEAIEFAATTIANYVGFYDLAGNPHGGEPVPAMANLVSATAVLLLILSDLPHEIVRALVSSYTILPQGRLPEARQMLGEFVDTIASAFLIGLRISGPFLLYGLVANLAFGIIGRLIPQIPAYFVSAPFVTMGGLVLLLFGVTVVSETLIGTIEAARLLLPLAPD